MFPDTVTILQDIYLGKYENMRIAAASSADTPRAVQIGRTAMSMLEIIPGVTMRDVFSLGWELGFEGNIQIGRTTPLTSDKAMSHFPILRRETGIEYHNMVFFDDCNWSDHCSRVESICKGVIAQRTPDGIRMNEWHTALERYSNNKMS